MERLSFRKRAAALTVGLLGISALGGCAQSYDETYSIGVECAENTILDVLHVDNGFDRGEVQITCRGDNFHSEPRSIEVIGEENAAVIDEYNLERPSTYSEMQIAIENDWRYGDSTEISEISTTIGNGSASIYIDPVDKISSVQVVG
jgi:hypothetical protein